MTTVYPFKKEVDHIVDEICRAIRMECSLVESDAVLGNFKAVTHEKISASTAELVLITMPSIKETFVRFVEQQQDETNGKYSHFIIVAATNLRKPGDITLMLYLSQIKRASF